MKNRTEINYIPVTTMSSFDINKGTLFCITYLYNILTRTVDVKVAIIKYAAQPLAITIFFIFKNPSCSLTFFLSRHRSYSCLGLYLLQTCDTHTFM